MAVPLWLAIAVGLLASLVQAFGLALQRKSHLRPARSRPLWLAGLAIFLTSNVLGSLFQIGAMPIVVLAPLGAVSLLFNALFAKLLLGDVFTPSMGVGTVLITTGAVLIALFGVVDEPLLEFAELLRLCARKEWRLFAGLVGGAVVVALAGCHTVEHLLHRRTSSYGPIHLPSDDAVAAAAISPETPPFPKLPSGAAPPSPSRSAPPPAAAASRAARTRLCLALAYAFISGTLSGLCLLFAKTGVELLLSTVASRTAQFSPGTVVFGGGGLIVLALAQLAYLNHALTLESPTVVCPAAFSAYNLASVSGGLVYFDQARRLARGRLALVALGVGVLLVGVGTVSVGGGGGCGGAGEGREGGCEGGGGVGVGVWVEEEGEEEDDDDETDGDDDDGPPRAPDASGGSEPCSPAAAGPPSPSSPAGAVRARAPSPTHPPPPPPPRRLGSPARARPPRRPTAAHAHARYLPPFPSPTPLAAAHHPSPAAGGPASDPHPPVRQDEHPTSTGLLAIGLGAASPGFFVVGRPQQQRAGRRGSDRWRVGLASAAAAGGGASAREEGEREGRDGALAD